MLLRKTNHLKRNKQFDFNVNMQTDTEFSELLKVQTSDNGIKRSGLQLENQDMGHRFYLHTDLSDMSY